MTERSPQDSLADDVREETEAEPAAQEETAPEDAGQEETAPEDAAQEETVTEAEESAPEQAPEPQALPEESSEQLPAVEVLEARLETVEESASEEPAPPEVAESAEETAPEEAAAEPEPAAEEPATGELPAEVPLAEEPAAEAAPEPTPAPTEAVAAELAEEPAAEAEAAPAAPDPFGGPGDWYVVHTYAGYENKVKANLESRIGSMQMQDKIFDVHIPMEDVMEIKGGKKQVVQRKVFPGYLLVKMIYDNDSWYVVRNTPGVTGFVSSGTGTKPTPLSKREVEKILTVPKQEVKPQFRLEFEEGDVVRIISGPFADFNGTVDEINVDQSKLKVLVNIFDRETPVELGFDQVAKV